MDIRGVDAAQEKEIVMWFKRSLEERLDTRHFMRVNRRHIVNLRFVREVGPSPAGGLVLMLEGGLNVDMSRRRAVEFKQLKRL